MYSSIMEYGDTTDGVLAIVFGVSLLTCGSSVLLTALFPCSCRPKRDCKRNCADCKRDRQKCRQKWYDCCVRRERASTEEELMGPV
jgi:hypothetical protein